ncbi:hypothetical protein F1880_004723 [Penicillium rolfsii]|nr:hypothetical protein F1880_004723 [Penicillium rolfsii]
MKALKLFLFIFLSLINLGLASKLAAPAEMLAMYNAYVLDFLKNGAKRTLAPKLANDALVDFGTFVSHVWVDVKPPRNGLFLSQNPEYSKATLNQITEYLSKKPLYDVESLLRGVTSDDKIIHKDVLEKLSDIVQSTRDSNTPGFPDKWKAHLPEFKRALAGTSGARINEMFTVGLKPLFEGKFEKTLQSSPFPVLDTDVSYDRADWGSTLAAMEGGFETVGEWRTWYVGLRNTKTKGARGYVNHLKITTSIARSLTELDSVDSCK